MNGADAIHSRGTPPVAVLPPPKPPKPPVSAARLQAKKNMLQSRRWNIVLLEVIAAIMASRAAEVTVDLVDLVVLFGTHHRRVPAQGWREDMKRGALWPWLDRCVKHGYPVDREVKVTRHGFRTTQTQLVKETDRNEALWDSLKPVICDQLRGFRLVGDIISDKVDEDIRRVGALISYPVHARKCTADATIKVPKSWGKGLDIHTLLPA